MDDLDTIFAVATGSGKSAIAIVRVSGSQCAAVLRSVCRRRVWQTREAIFASIYDGDGELIDKAIVLVFEAPLSFTGENMIEFQISGGRGVKSALLNHLSMFTKTRSAEPGEFARRAFENGKIDLIQVEGLAAVVDAETHAEARHSALMAFGRLSSECERARAELVKAASLLEGFLDFSDVEDPLNASLASVIEALREARDILEGLRVTSRVSERLRTGYAVAIVGKPNAGKSTFINYLLQRDAALVSSFPGTTRDYLEFFVELAGFPIVLIDSAGFRETSEPIERMGIEKSKSRIKSADLILWLSEAEHIADDFLPSEVSTIRVKSKCDLPDLKGGSAAQFLISAQTGEGIEQLVTEVISRATAFFEAAASPSLGSARQVAAVDSALVCINRAISAVGLPEELLAEDIRASMTALGRVTGRVDVEDVLDEVFARMCVGK